MGERCYYVPYEYYYIRVDSGEDVRKVNVNREERYAPIAGGSAICVIGGAKNSLDLEVRAYSRQPGRVGG